MMNFSRAKKKLEKKIKPLPWTCYAIITEYVGLFFILSSCSIQSTFLLLCKILVYVVFAVANNTPYRSPLPESPYQLHPWVNRVTYLFIQFWFFFFFVLFCFFFLSIMFSSSKLQYSRLYFPFIYEVIEIFISSKLCEKLKQYRS